MYTFSHQFTMQTLEQGLKIIPGRDISQFRFIEQLQEAFIGNLVKKCRSLIAQNGTF